MMYSKEFFDLQLQFARRVAELSGMPFEQALLDYTNLYIRFGLGRKFDSKDPVWIKYLSGLQSSADKSDWTYCFFLTRPHNIEPPDLSATFGCFSYSVLRDDYIRIHFQNAEPKERSPLSAACITARLAELRLLFQNIKQTQHATPRVAGASWLYNLDAYRRLFPAAYLASAKVTAQRFRNMPLWGQFLDRHGAIRQTMATPFLERLASQTGITDISQCFPFQPIEVEAPATDFYEFYDIK